MDEIAKDLPHSSVARIACWALTARVFFALTCAVALMAPCLAADVPSVQSPVPPEVDALVPAGMRLIFFRADNGRAEGSDAVAILAQAKPSADAEASNGPRPLLMLRKVGGVYKLEARNDAIIACSTCGEDKDDPFTPAGISLTPNHLVIEQDYGSASSSVYKFVRDPKSRRWEVVSAVDTRGTQSLTGGGFQKSSTALKLPNPPLLADFDPGWKTPQFWNAVAVNDTTHDFSFLSSSLNGKDLDERVERSCKASGFCHVLVKQRAGCVALAKDRSGKFYAASADGVSSASQSLAKSHALDQCTKQSAGACEAVRSDCASNAK